MGLGARGAALAIGLTVIPPAARAQAPPEAAADDGRLLRTLSYHADRGRSSRAVSAVGNAVEAAALLPTGIVLATASDEELRLVGVGLVVFGATALVEIPFALTPGFLERLRTHYLGRRARGEGGAVAVAETEAEWKEGVDRDRRYRPLWGVLNVAFGTVCLAAGATSLLVAPGKLGMSRQTQYTLGSVMVPLGLEGAWDGVWLLTTPTGVEAAWDVYRAGAPTSRSSSLRPALSVVATAGGAGASLRLPF